MWLFTVAQELCSNHLAIQLRKYSAEVSFGTSAEVSGHFGHAEVS